MDKPKLSHQLLTNAGAAPVDFAAGQVIFEKDAPGTEMYVVRSGEVQIEIDGKPVGSLGPGDIFGEMALIDGSPRSATARAKTACEIVPLTEKSFLFLVDEMPFFALSVMRTLAERLRRMDSSA
jgi:CRP/FNR family transcriptional regulator, cyclic AMP receptor protein